jgi:hypothetical protein
LYGKSKKRKVKEKKMKQTNKCALILCMAVAAVILLTSGCVNQAETKISPGANLGKVNKIYVEHFAPDKRNLHKMIADQFNKLGYEATAGETGAKPEGVDAIATYRDRWMWDITNYLFELTITLREPQGEYPLAVGRALHSSLTRKSPEQMIEEVCTNISKQAKNPSEGVKP